MCVDGRGGMAGSSLAASCLMVCVDGRGERQWLGRWAWSPLCALTGAVGGQRGLMLSSYQRASMRALTGVLRAMWQRCVGVEPRGDMRVDARVTACSEAFGAIRCIRGASP